MGSFRLLPLVAFAALCLFALKSAGLLLSGSYTLSGVAPAVAQAPGATPDGDAGAKPEQEDAKPETRSAESTEPAKPAAAEAEKGGKKTKTAEAAPEDVEMRSKGSEGAVLKSLADRRRVLEKRERELQLRENLLQAAEKRVAARIAELKAIESRIDTELKSQDAERDAKFNRLVKVYSSMKPKAAAAIFDRLDIDVLMGLVKRMKARNMSAIMAKMDPAAAQRLTLRMASETEDKSEAISPLPKINSR